MDSIRTNFSELLAAFTSEDSLTILTAFLGTLLIGWLMRYFWDRWTIKGLEESLEKNDREKLHFKNQWERLQEQHALQEADLKKATLELADKTTNLEAADAEKRALNSRLNTTLVDLDKSREEFQEATSRMEDLNDQILGLRTKNAQLNTEMEQKSTTANQYAISQGATSIYQQEVADLTAENALLKNSIEALKANTTAEGTTEATLRITELEHENEELKTTLESTIADRGQNETDSSEETSALRARLTELEAKNDKLEDSLAEIAQLEGGNEALNTSIHTLITENEDLQANSDQLVQYEAGNEILNTTIADLIAKNDALKLQLEEQAQNQIEWSVGANADTLPEEMEEVEELDVEGAKTKFRAAIGDQIARASSEERDDLKQINGIGPFIEEKLNDLGIYTFEQVSQLDDDMVETLTAAIEFFPGRIDRDDWVGQADRLFYTNTNSSAPREMGEMNSKIVTRRYATATEKIDAIAISRRTEAVKPDDLKKIEGIGPKISQILNDAGIYTFANLSQTPVDRIKGILADAGNRYKAHDPQTWPQQAQLAAAEEWEKLKELQDRLDGGRDISNG